MKMQLGPIIHKGDIFVTQLSSFNAIPATFS